MGKFKNPLKVKPQTGYQKMKSLPVDQYGKYRDRINSQQAARKIRNTQGYDSSKVFGLVGGIGTFISGLGATWVVSVMYRAINGMMNGKGSSALSSASMSLPWWAWPVNLLVGTMVGFIVYDKFKRKQSTDRILDEDGQLNDYTSDGHVMYKEEIVERFPVFPDRGAHSSVKPSAILSHAFLSNKGVPAVMMTKRYTADVIVPNEDDPEDFEIFYEGEEVLDSEGNPILEKKPMIDMDKGGEVFDKISIFEGNPQRVFDHAKELVFDSEGKARGDDQSAPYKSLIDMMNNDWEIPAYERQRPTGVYFVDTAPVNVMILAITRAGKGQTYIEALLDMWTREKRQWNIVNNDPKGELLVKFYVRATIRGYDIVQFNLINPMKTDIFNPLGYAVEAAREGRMEKVAEYLTNLSSVFFPKDGGEDPVWPQSASAAFERTCLALIDFYREEEMEMRRRAELDGRNVHLLDAEINNMWGKVTLYNVFKMFSSLVSKKETDPMKTWVKEEDKPPTVINDETGEEVLDPSVKPTEKVLLDLFFDATEALPKNRMRDLLDSSNKTLKSMMQSEKMLSSVYGIATASMRFFTDPTIIALTSGTASQNFDIESLSFPRRVAVRFTSEWMARYKYAGKLVRWSAWSDDTFTEELDPKLFGHSFNIGRDGWVHYAFDGKFEGRDGYIKMEIVNPDNNVPMKIFYFKARLDYLTRLDGKSFIKNPVTKEKILRNGTLTELRPVKDKEGRRKFVPRNTMIKKTVKDFRNYSEGGRNLRDKEIEVHAFSDLKLRYTDKPKFVNFITPPHLTAYARLILILIKQVTDSAFSSAYLTKANQKPLYGTNYMLDELGNLQSDGHGINDLETLLSIGLSADQRFHLILQTLQQLEAVYGGDKNKIISGNSNDLIFLKSNDVTMIDDLVAVAGKRHVERVNSLTVSENTQSRVQKTDGRISKTKTVLEEDVISRNEFLRLDKFGAIVMRAGDDPIYNYGASSLPPVFAMQNDTIQEPGVEYTLQTIPTMSSVLEFDPEKNQPNFYAMLEKRLSQARLVEEMESKYRGAYGYSQHDIDIMDADEYARDIMDAVNDELYEIEQDYLAQHELDDEMSSSGNTSVMYENIAREREASITVNVDYEKAVTKAEKELVPDYREKIYAGGMVSRDMLVSPHGKGLSGGTGMDAVVIEAVLKTKSQFMGDTKFRWDDDKQILSNAAGVRFVSYDPSVKEYEKSAQDPDSKVYMEATDGLALEGYRVEPEFYEYLAKLDSWESIAGGSFDKTVRDICNRRENTIDTDAPEDEDY